MTGDIDVKDVGNEVSGAEARALRQLVEEARQAPPPSLNWDDVEARLMARIAADEASRERQRANRGPKWGAVVGMTAAAAALVMLVAGVGGDTTAPSAEAITPSLATPDQLTRVDPAEGAASYVLRGMRPHTAVESGAEPMRFTLPGVVDWTLAPNSRVVVEAVPTPDAAGTVPHVVRLERGRIEAAVVPRHDSNQLVEAFVVEAGATRVAVHGTRFSVERHQELVEVEVTRGTVTVGPARHRGATTGHLLVSPRRASFRAGQLIASTEAVASSEAAEPAIEPRDATQAGAAAPDEARADAASEPSAVAQARPGIVTAPAPEPSESEEGEPDGTDQPDAEAPTSTPKLSVAEAQGRVVSCLAGAAPEGTGQGTKVTVSSQVTAVLGKEGEVQSVQFSPPLRPDLQQRCAGVLFGQKLEASGKVSFPVQVRAE